MDSERKHFPFEAYGYVLSSFSDMDGAGFVIKVPEFEFWAADGDSELKAIENGRLFYRDWSEMMASRGSFVNEPRMLSPKVSLLKLDDDSLAALEVPAHSLNCMANIVYETMLELGVCVVDISLFGDCYESEEVEHSVWIETSGGVDETVEMNLRLAERFAGLDEIVMQPTIIFRPSKGEAGAKCDNER